MNLYKSIKYYLTEMSLDKERLIQRILDKTEKINDLLLKCLLIQNTTNNLNHWSTEIYSFLPRIQKLKGKNKLPSEKLLTTYTLGYFQDTLLEYMDAMIISMNDIENTNIIEYNKQALYDCIIDYYKWLIPNLANTGNVNIIAVKQEIKELIEKYNKLN